MEVRSTCPGDHEHREQAASVRLHPLERDGHGVRANRKDTNVGGHIASFASAATLYDVGFNHFWHAPTDEHGGDLVFFQGHSAPGIYARAYLLGRLTEDQLDNFRQEVDGKGLSSYPHPWLMPDFWQFPTVSMGLGPLMAIYQARFMKYLAEPRPHAETRTARSGLPGRRRDGRARVAGRDRHGRRARSSTTCLRHQLQPAAPRRPGARQRQDHPGTRKRVPRRRLERHQGHLGHALGPAAREGQEGHPAEARMEEASTASTRLQGQGRRLRARALLRQVSRTQGAGRRLSDDDIWRLNRGGHDPHKIYAAYTPR
jgi:pyruvate dehydrogenase E1 component